MRPLIGYTAGEMARRAFIEACDREDEAEIADYQIMRALGRAGPDDAITWAFKPDFELDS